MEGKEIQEWTIQPIIRIPTFPVIRLEKIFQFVNQCSGTIILTIVRYCIKEKEKKESPKLTFIIDDELANEVQTNIEMIQI